MGNLDKGVLLIANHHENYVKMACNLAASIRTNSPDLPIAIISDLPVSNRHLFDKVIKYTSKDPVKAKTRIYKASPFQKTLYLDVDMILLAGVNLNNLFKELDGVPFTIMNTYDPKKEECIWLDANRVRELSGNTETVLPKYYSELIYFEKGEAAEAYFKEVANQYDHCPERGTSFAGGMADELAFILASMKTRILPHKLNWKPVFWYFRDKADTNKQPFQLKDRYYAYSIGGNTTPDFAKVHYNNLAEFYARRQGIHKPYKVIDKKLYLSNRILL